MFQLVTLLYLSAVLGAAYERSPASVAYRKNVIHPRNSEGQRLLGSFGNYDQFWYKNMKGSLDSPRIYAHEQESAEINRMKLRNGTRKYNAGRGLLASSIRLIDSTLQRLRDTAEKTTKLTEEILEDSVKLTKDIVKESAQLSSSIIGNLTKRAIDWMTAETMKIGRLMVGAPLHAIEVTINAAWAAHKLGAGLTAQIISDTADWFQGNWEAVKAIEFPGKNLIVLLYPSGVMSVVNGITKDIMYMIDTGHKTLTHAFAYTLYVSLEIVFDTVHSVINLSNLDCVKLIPQKITVDEKMIDTISSTSGEACGVSHLKPMNNVTITRNDDKFLIIKTPWVLEDLSTRWTGVKVIGQGIIGEILDNEVMDTKIERIRATGTISFEAGTLLRFVSIHIEVDSLEGLTVNFPTNEKSRWMESIESLSGRFSSLVTEEINHVLRKVEKKVFDYIANI